MRSQRLIATRNPGKRGRTPPRVADAFILLDDERLDPECCQARPEHESVLPAADDQARRVLVLKLFALAPLVEPVVAALVQAVFGPERALVSELFLVSLDLPEGGEERECAPVAGPGTRLAQAEETFAAALRRLVRRKGFEPVRCLVELGVRGLNDLETLQGGNAVARKVVLDLALLNRVEVKVEGLRGTVGVQSDIELKRRGEKGTDQHVAPPAVVGKMSDDSVRVLCVECGLDRVAKTLSGLGGAVGVVGHDMGARQSVLDVRDGLLERVEDARLSLNSGSRCHSFRGGQLE